MAKGWTAVFSAGHLKRAPSKRTLGVGFWGCTLCWNNIATCTALKASTVLLLSGMHIVLRHVVGRVVMLMRMVRVVMLSWEGRCCACCNALIPVMSFVMHMEWSYELCHVHAMILWALSCTCSSSTPLQHGHTAKSGLLIWHETKSLLETRIQEYRAIWIQGLDPVDVWGYRDLVQMYWRML